ncbi:hypothetical protein PDIDSM_1759 [Penicillium digitatum]|nr:hypothetical protein PDIDSM_1759 [Penicillium digitatum]
MDRRYGPDDQDEKVELNTYRGIHPNTSFEHPEPSASSSSPRPLTPVRPGHLPTDDYGQPVWLQPTARMSGHSDSFNNSPWDSRTPYDSRSASPTLYQNHEASHQSLAPLVSSPAPPSFEKDWVKSGSIARIHDRDDAETWKGWKRWVFFLVPFLTLANTGIYLFYLDVFITCCGEDDEVVLDTVRGACDQDYPRDQMRVIILDDAHSLTLEAACNQLALNHPNVIYMAREKIPGKPHHFKAGNLNYGLDQTNLLPGGAGQFMAALDADMIPEQDWLRAILPHLLVDPKMALACPPQLFYNTPASDPLAQSLDFFVHVIEPIKDALGVAWCTGSGYVVRREALEEIGNFPLGSLAEDVATSTLMLGRGWKTAYIHEALQFGTVPEDFGGHLKQRTRWAIGTVDTAVKLKFCLWGDAVRQMTFAQRFSGFLYATLSVYTLLLTISLFAIPVILLWGKRLVAFATEEQLRWLIWACFAATISNRLCEMALFIPAGYHTGQRGSRYQLWMSPYIALCIVRSFFLPTWLGGQTQAFKPTGSLGSALNERDPKKSKNMFVRLRNNGFRDIILCPFTHAFWPPLTFLFICTSLWTPVSYAIDPPKMPEREELLTRDPKTGVAHPTKKSKKIAFGGQAAWFELEYTVATVATILVFVYSFIF